jgi:hypothetical protein
MARYCTLVQYPARRRRVCRVSHDELLPGPRVVGPPHDLDCRPTAGRQDLPGAAAPSRLPLRASLFQLNPDRRAGRGVFTAGAGPLSGFRGLLPSASALIAKRQCSRGPGICGGRGHQAGNCDRVHRGCARGGENRVEHKEQQRKVEWRQPGWCQSSRQTSISGRPVARRTRFARS